MKGEELPGSEVLVMVVVNPGFKVNSCLFKFSILVVLLKLKALSVAVSVWDLDLGLL